MEQLINDNWIFTKENNLHFAQDRIKDGHAVTLPHSWNEIDGQGSTEPYYRGQCWYQHMLYVTEEQLHLSLFLEFGAAGNQARVYVNGRLAGENRCGYAMFRVPINKYIQAGENLIAIQVDNSADNEVFPIMADFTFYGGLYRDVKLLALDSVHFDVMDNGRDGIYCTQQKLDENNYNLQVSGQIINESSLTLEGVIHVILQDAEGGTVKEWNEIVQLHDEVAFHLSGTIEQPTLWNGIEQPYLYKVVATIYVDNQLKDTRTVPIGFRTIEATTDRGLLLNGKPIKLNGVCRHQDFAGVANAINRQHMELDMSLIREIGANSIRLAHYQHDDYFYSLCDQYGLLVWAEIPFISVPSTADPNNTNAFEQLERLIKQAYNHCSIYCWGVQNEITIAVETEHTHRTINQLVSLAKQLDPQRMTAQANINGVEDHSIINTYTDLIGYNLYYGWYYGEIEDLGKRFDSFHYANPNTPVILSEYGVDTNPKFHSYTPQVQDYTEEYQLLFHHNAIQTINARPYVQGGYVWNMFDFGSANRKEGGEIGKNLKGLVTIDRKLKKDAFYLYKAYWSKEPVVYIAGRRFVNRHRQVNDIVVLSNLSEIRIYVDNLLIGNIQSDEVVKVLKDVELSLGNHTISVEGIDEFGAVFTDTIQLNIVESYDKSYELEKQDAAKNVINWFERFDLSDAQVVELKEGYFSTYDTIVDLYSNELAKAVFLKYFQEFSNHPFFEATQTVMSIRKMSQLAFFNIPPELLAVIDRELNVIKKL